MEPTIYVTRIGDQPPRKVRAWGPEHAAARADEHFGRRDHFANESGSPVVRVLVGEGEARRWRRYEPQAGGNDDNPYTYTNLCEYPPLPRRADA